MSDRLERREKGRDGFLDDLRALGVLWVLWVHTLYWTGVFPGEPYWTLKSLFLLEMPLFFFLSGAGLGLGETGAYAPFVMKRFRRVLVPYWCCALLCVALEAANALSLGSFSWPWLGRVALSWALPVERQIAALPNLTTALWYVPAYLLCMLLFPLLAKYRRYPAAVLCVLGGLWSASAALGWYWPQTVCFYCLWLYAGLWYPALKARYIDRRGSRWQLLLAAGLGLGAMLLLRRGGCLWDMQANKFPPNRMFLAYSVTALSLLWLAAPGLSRLLRWLRRWRPLGWLLSRLGRYGLTVFLYQSWAFLALRPVYLLANRQNWPGPVACVVCFAGAAALCALLTVPLGRLEELGRRGKK